MILKGYKVNLRKLKKSDAVLIYKNANDKDIERFTTIPFPYKLEGAFKFVSKSHINIRHKKAFSFGIIEITSNLLIGIISLDSVDLVHNNAEIGFWLGKKFRGKGYMTEAIKLILNFGFNELKLERIYARVVSINIISQNILKKIGFVYEGTMRKSFLKNNRYMDDQIFSILSKDFKNLKN